MKSLKMWLPLVLMLSAGLAVLINGKLTQAQGGPDPELIKDRGVAPELTNTIWINSDKPLRLAALRGQVVLIQFWTFECINCYHTLPYMKDAFAKYKTLGVQFIGVHYPEFDYERDLNNVKNFIVKEGITYPVTTDNDGAAWNAYEMHAWPAFIIVDKNGHMRYRQIGEGGYDMISQVLDALIAEPAPRDVLPIF